MAPTDSLGRIDARLLPEDGHSAKIETAITHTVFC